MKEQCSLGTNTHQPTEIRKVFSLQTEKKKNARKHTCQCVINEETLRIVLGDLAHGAALEQNALTKISVCDAKTPKKIKLHTIRIMHAAHFLITHKSGCIICAAPREKCRRQA